MSYFQKQGEGERDFYTNEEGSGVGEEMKRRGRGPDLLRRSGLIIENSAFTMGEKKKAKERK